MDVKIGGVLIHSEDPKALRDWYAKAFRATPDEQGEIGEDGFAIQAGDDQYFLFFSHDQISGSAKEPARVIVNIQVDDAGAVASQLDSLGARWIRPFEDGGPGRIGTVADPDGNYVQLLQTIEGAHA